MLLSRICLPPTLSRSQTVRNHSSKALPCVLYSSSVRQIQTRDPNYEDDRWLEAELANKEMSAEERYAFLKQREVIKQMMSKVADHAKEKANAENNVSKSEVDLSRNDLEKKITALEAEVARLKLEEKKPL
mmetsp:Transcript_29395/g.40605  ORF Transcript_29395/g.40605 Transcript_29395/m.40605 type:complete len:131 (-) Transcript_29395:381-773(-)|eukprot:CAMPEP_0201501268 /NCGR_PEP_ID=MMETSP0151_2-20130828/83499_1 /ASSEMBLY_ACC=CAM_ASM_000257 /TAXON_ID=200890 /ORGANISM="Paramoeba atlantica, Strain 621/1 / CCAP 1560/9" /LENGTH=130 /DNA_ID=CAMNT_0047894761 /DNA_START=868 /DNA_END=1260 /DNA_ORIENTATION=+